MQFSMCLHVRKELKAESVQYLHVRKEVKAQSVRPQPHSAAGPKRIEIRPYASTRVHLVRSTPYNYIKLSQFQYVSQRPKNLLTRYFADFAQKQSA